MKCPRCAQSDLQVIQRNGVEIDLCSNCRGIWLDRGELEKIIERSTLFTSDKDHDDYQNYSNQNHNRHGEEQYHGDHHDDHHDKKNHRRSWLSDLFD